MNRKLKMQIRMAFAVPSTTRKKEFLQSIDFPKATYFDFILSQIGYIRKRVWLISGILVIGALLGIRFDSSSDIFKLIWIVSSVLPFIALIAITEISRSNSYHMVELEMSCRYSLSDIVLARLGILGSLNFIIFTILLLLLKGRTDYGFCRLGIYILVPFLLTCTLSLFVLNHMKVRENTYICGSISCFVSFFNAISVYSKQILFCDRYLFLWGVVFFGLLILMIIQTIKLIKERSDLEWNLPLIA